MSNHLGFVENGRDWSRFWALTYLSAETGTLMHLIVWALSFGAGASQQSRGGGGSAGEGGKRA